MKKSPKSPQVVVITGASAGVGRAIAQRFARDGARIGLLARGRDGLEATRREVEAAGGGQALALEVDVSKAEEVERAAQDIEAKFGPIDIWVNNAMASVFSPIIEILPEEFRRVTEVTYLGSVYGTLAALKRMRKRNRGTIIQVGSALAYRGIPLQAPYCAAKHAIEGFTESLRCELIHDRCRVRLSVVQLPAMNTPQFSWVKSRLPRKPQPVPPIYQPEIAADAVHFASRHHPREIYLGMPTILAIVGNKVFPAFLDRYLAAHGYDSQQTAEIADPERPDNLWSPVAGDHGAHGSFDAQARSFCLEWWLRKHRASLLVLVALLVVILVILLYAVLYAKKPTVVAMMANVCRPGPEQSWLRLG